jgi:hypothetical protein
MKDALGITRLTALLCITDARSIILKPIINVVRNFNKISTNPNFLNKQQLYTGNSIHFMGITFRKRWV